MDPSAINLTPLSRALDRLREGLARWQSTPDDAQLRDGLIQRFEFCIEAAKEAAR